MHAYTQTYIMLDSNLDNGVIFVNSTKFFMKNNKLLNKPFELLLSFLISFEI